jgi:hypothetical protein
MRLRLLIVLLGFVYLCGCTQPQIKPVHWGPALAEPDLSTLDLLSAVGDKGTIIVALRPDQWASNQSVLRTFFEGFPIPEDIVEKIFSAPDLVSAAVRTLALSLGETLDWTGSLPGLDTKRPTLAGLFEPTTNSIPMAAPLLTPGEHRPTGLSGFRHRLLIPAVDVPVLTASLTKLVGSYKLKAATNASRQDTSVYPFPNGEGFLAIIPEKDHVRIEVLTHDLHASQAQGKPASTIPSQWNSLLEQQPPAGKLLASPAMHFLATGQDLITVYFRPWQFGNIGGHLGMYQIKKAICFADPAHKAELATVGLAEIINGYLIMSPIGAEMDDIAIGFSARDLIRFTEVASLTELGTKILQAGTQVRTSAYSRSDMPSIFNFSIPADLESLINQAEEPSVMARAKNIRRGVEAYQECGIFCIYHSLLRNPVGTAKSIRRLIEYEPAQIFPQAFDLSIVELNFKDRQNPIKAALVAVFPKGYDTAWLREGLKIIEQPQFSTGLKTQLVVETVAEKDVVLIGINIDPREVYTIKNSTLPDGQLAEFSYDMSALADQIGKRDPAAGKIFGQFRHMSGRAFLSDRAMIGEIVIGKAENNIALFSKNSDYSGMKWPSPGLAETKLKGSQCLNQALYAVMMAFKALAQASVRDKAGVVKRAFEEHVYPLIDCARQDKFTKQVADDLYLDLTLIVDKFAADAENRELRLEVLSKACANGVTKACQIEKEVRSQPDIRLARLALPCGSAPTTKERQVVITAEGTKWQGEADASKPYGLMINKNIEYAEVAKALAALSVKNIEQLEVYYKGSDAGLVAIPARLPTKADQAAPKDEKILPLVIKIGDKTVRVVGPGGEISVAAPQNCRPSGPCLDFAELSKTLRQVHEAFPKAKYYLNPENGTDWESVAAVLSMIVCAKNYASSSRPEVFLGKLHPKI